MCFFKKKKKKKEVMPIGTKHIYFKQKLDEHKALLVKDMLESIPGVSCVLGDFMDITIFIKSEVKLKDIENKLRECKVDGFRII